MSDVDALKKFLADLFSKLAKMDPATGARISGWVAGITGTLAVAALVAGNAPAAAVLGGASIVATAANMYFTDLQYRRGDMPAYGYYFTQAWNTASLGLGGLGLFTRSLNAPRLIEQIAIAANIRARPLGWGGISINYWRW